MSKLKTARSASAFETTGIWDDTVPWRKMVGKFFVDEKNEIQLVKKINYTLGTVTLLGGREVPGRVIDDRRKSMHNTWDEAREALSYHQS